MSCPQLCSHPRMVQWSLQSASHLPGFLTRPTRSMKNGMWTAAFWRYVIVLYMCHVQTLSMQLQCVHAYRYVYTFIYTSRSPCMSTAHAGTPCCSVHVAQVLTRACHYTIRCELPRQGQGASRGRSAWRVCRRRHQCHGMLQLGRSCGFLKSISHIWLSYLLTASPAHECNTLAGRASLMTFLSGGFSGLHGASFCVSAGTLS